MDDSGICVGFADALAARLGNLPGMDVLPTAVVLNVPVEVTAAETASRLGVCFIVQGGYFDGNLRGHRINLYRPLTLKEMLRSFR